ncbi:MAG: thiamine pyrophosphate-dependent enzyme [Candidatus Eisenbacteria bacterium]
MKKPAKGTPTAVESLQSHPMADLLRMDRMPHIWCSSCGLGSTLTCFIMAVRESGVAEENVAVVSGIGCTGRVAGYLNLDSFHTTHGRAIPFATGLALSNPDLRVVVYSGDGDLVAIGGNHFIHSARRNMDLLVVCVNNFTYGMTGGQAGPTTPIAAKAATAPYGSYEFPFNLPALAAASGATYVARWTALHLRRLKNAMAEALVKRGFRFIEIICPCPTAFAHKNRLGSGLDLMKYYHDSSVIQHGADPRDVDIPLQGRIIVGKFVDIEKPTYREFLTDNLSKIVGGKK